MSREAEAVHATPVYQRWTVDSPNQLASVRAQLRSLAGVWADTEDCTDRLLMSVNELVSNAVDHARTACEITVRRSRSLVRVLVADQSPLPPRIPPRDVNAARGRGLHMVQALSSRWGWTTRHGGKTVWAVVNCSEA